jgi:hypothetical protein
MRLCHRLYVCHLYLASFFFWWGTYRADMLHDIIHSYCIKKLILKAKRNFKKIDSDSKSYLENPLNFDPSWFLRPVSKFWVSTLSRNLIKFSTIFLFIVSTNLDSIKPKSRNRQITSFSSNQNFQQSPTTFRDHNWWIVNLIVTHE